MSKKRMAKAALVRRPAATPEELAANPALMFERLAKDKHVDVNKLERLIAMQERIMAVNAKAAFDADFAVMAPTIPAIPKNGRIVVDSGPGQRATPYSTNEDIQKVLRPILAAHGFAISFRTEYPEKGLIRIVGVLTHRQGHTRESLFESAGDDSGKKNKIQAIGSTISYGHRYTTKDLLNITEQGEDDNGKRAAASRQRESGPPAAGHDATATDPISDKQRRRLFVLMKNGGRNELEVKAWLAVAYNIDSTKKIKRRDYDAICTAVERPGALPAPREPGEDG